MNSFSHVPPGFRFHPTDEELVDYYLRKKVTARRIDLDVIKDVDLYKIEPWDLQELCRIGTEEQNEWYFFSHKDKKYPTGTRTNRATAAGFWKATGRDKAIYSKHDLIGMRKTLVFYKGRAPNGQKSDWIMHEYRLETDENATSQEEGWVVCRVFKKRITTMRKVLSEHESPSWYDEQVSFMPELDSPQQSSHLHPTLSFSLPSYPCKKELERSFNNMLPHQHDPDYLPLPLLEPPKMTMPFYGAIHTNHGSSLTQEEHRALQSLYYANNNPRATSDDQVTDWRVLDKFVACQLSHDVSNENGNTKYPMNPGDHAFQASDHSTKQPVITENASTSTSSNQMDLWN